MAAVCPAGHRSDETDYCSVCGARIVGARIEGAPQRAFVKETSLGLGKMSCPSCGEPREDADARFCEVCRYDFQERRPGPPPVARRAVAMGPHAAPNPGPLGGPPASPTPSPTAALGTTPGPAAAPRATAWELVVSVDPALDTDPDPAHPPPRGAPDVVVPVDRDDMLVGRHDETRAIHPEIPLHDPGASRRHARFVREADGVSLQDLASTNGTQLNARDVAPGARLRLRDGDSVTLGRWTRIMLRARA